MSYPSGYGRTRVTLPELEARYGGPMHPEFRRRLFAWLEAQGGLIGIGSAWRPTPSNTSAASRAGHSFHQTQRFASGIHAIAAVDLVARNGSSKHRAPTWSEVPRQGTQHADIARFGVWCNVAHEPWHMQPVPIDGYMSWRNAGRRDPEHLEHLDAPHRPPVIGGPPDVANGDYGLYPLDRHKATRRLGDRDPHVGYAQAVMANHAGLPVSIDDRFGPQTEHAVRAFQHAHHLEVDGLIGPRTWAELDRLALRS